MSRKSKYTDDQVIEAVKHAVSITGALRLLNTCIYGSNNPTSLKKKIAELSLDTSHFTGQAWNRGKRHPTSVDIEKYLCKDSSCVSTNHLKKRLLKLGLLVPICKECGIGTTWNNRPLVLHMDHINGNKTDNRLENLQMLCPNCHSQTTTYAGKNKAYLAREKPNICDSEIEYEKVKINDEVKTKVKRVRTQYFCVCGSEMSRTSIRCGKCNAINQYKTTWPPKEELEKLVWQKSVVQIAKELGVSDNAVAHRCSKLKIKKPPRGYWEKVYHGVTQPEQNTEDA